jgi:hypothetical protein
MSFLSQSCREELTHEARVVSPTLSPFAEAYPGSMATVAEFQTLRLVRPSIQHAGAADLPT